MEYVDSLVVSVKTRKLTEAEARRYTVWAFWKAIAAISMQVNQSSTRLCEPRKRSFSVVLHISKSQSPLSVICHICNC